MDNLNNSLEQYNNQLLLVREALNTATDDKEREPLLELQSELQQLIQLTQESLDTVSVSSKGPKVKNDDAEVQKDENNDLDDEYALFMQEMAKTGAYENNKDKPESLKENSQNEGDDSDIEDELSSLLGMKCAVYHIHKWGGQPSLHNAMVSAIVPRQDEDQFKDLQVRVLFTHPTHAEMLPCPYFLDGECRFNDEQCRYSHGAIVPVRYNCVISSLDGVTCILNRAIIILLP